MKNIHPLTAGAELIDHTVWPKRKPTTAGLCRLWRQRLARCGLRIRPYLAMVALSLSIGLIFLGASYVFLSQLARYGW